MTHLAQNATIGAGDAFDCQNGTVGVNRKVHRRVTHLINILRCNLACRSKLSNRFRACHETALAVADGNRVDIAHIAARKPRRKARSNARANQAALMATDGVKRKRGSLGRCRNDIAIGNQAQLDKSLEAIANTQHQTIALLKQLTYRFGNGGRTEECRDELR